MPGLVDEPITVHSFEHFASAEPILLHQQHSLAVTPRFNPALAIPATPRPIRIQTADASDLVYDLTRT